MSSDFIREVDEEVRRDRIEKLWAQYSIHAIALAVLVVLAVAGWRGYEWYQARHAAEAGAAFEAARALAEQGKHAEAAQAYAKLAASDSGSYRVLARLRAADEQSVTDKAAAVKSYQAIAADSSVGRLTQDLATVRAALLQVDTVSYNDLRKELEPLTASDRPFRHSARELLALSAWHGGNDAEARRWADMIIADGETPAGIRSRTDILLGLLPATAKG